MAQPEPVGQAKATKVKEFQPFFTGTGYFAEAYQNRTTKLYLKHGFLKWGLRFFIAFVDFHFEGTSATN